MDAESSMLEVLAVVNCGAGNRNSWQLSSRLVGGLKTGAWKVRDLDGKLGVLKGYECQRSAKDVESWAALVRAARVAGWPTPEWHAWGVDRLGYPYTLVDFVEGAPRQQLDEATLDALLAATEIQRGLAAGCAVNAVNKSAEAWNSVFHNTQRWKSVLTRRSPDALRAGEAVARKAEPFRDIELPAVDLVHTDFGLHNVLFRDRALAAVVDLEGLSRGTVSIDLATLLFATHATGAYEERALQRLIEHALGRDGAPVVTVALASALFDWVIYATARLGAAEVTDFLVTATALFDRLR
ncbi:MAG TPA: phosphotransferase [Candidatus Limnocylindrales bacterium]|nr:phosphotransferase [Candidatus Limnocylindrales bacterium]